MRRRSMRSGIRQHLAGRRPLVLREVSLVLLLGTPEWPRRCDLGGDRPGVAPGGVLAVAGFPRHRVLLGIEGEDRRTVLAADVGALPVDLGGVVALPEQDRKSTRLNSSH